MADSASSSGAIVLSMISCWFGAFFQLSFVAIHGAGVWVHEIDAAGLPCALELAVGGAVIETDEFITARHPGDLHGRHGAGRAAVELKERGAIGADERDRVRSRGETNYCAEEKSCASTSREK